MRKWMGLTAVAVALVIGGSAAASFDSEWATYRSDKYGFYMLTPPGTRFVEREYGGGWGTLEGSYESIRFLAYGKLGERATPEDIERFGVRATGVPANRWKQVDQGQNRNGWSWWRVVEATDGVTLLFGGYGVGPKGSYLVLVRTTVQDYQEYKADYRKWYDSITVY
jgi:hypothetical protein